MTYTSKKTITNMVAGIGISLAYILYATGGRAPDPTDLRAWAMVMLTFIGIGIGVMIVVQILFHIGLSIGIAVGMSVGNTVKGKPHTDDEIEQEIQQTIDCNDVEDEMGKLINLKSAHIGYIVMGVGFLVSLIALACSVSVLTTLHIQLGAIALASLAEAFATIVLYERGV